MPRRRKSRIGANTESVEIQVTEEQRIVTTTTTCSAIPTFHSVVSSASQDSLVIPKSGFLELLRTVGATGKVSDYGEVFEMHKLSNHLRDYVKKQELFDVTDPVVVRLKDDPLSKVLGVSQFSLMDVRELLAKNSMPFTRELTVANGPEFGVAQGNAEPGTWYDNGAQGLTFESTLSGGHPNKKRRKRRRLNTSSSGSSETRNRRGRTSSISILYSDAEGSSHSYPYLVEFRVEESDSEDVLSVQSKATKVVSDSSDDYWFLEEDVTVEMVEVHSGNEDPPFQEEYEVDSDGSSIVVEETEGPSEESNEEDDSRATPTQHDMDQEFWADSESSDWESDETDLELSDTDKWPCQKCDWKNPPINRNCDRCWNVRDGWLPEQKDCAPRFPTDVKRHLLQKRDQERYYTSSDNESTNYYYQSKNGDSVKPTKSNYSGSMGGLIIDIPELNPKSSKTFHTITNNENSHFENGKQFYGYSPDILPYPVAGTSGTCHTFTPTADSSVPTNLGEDKVTEIGSSQITSSQDSGLHDCSPKESLDDTFDLTEHSEKNITDFRSSPAELPSMAHGSTILVNDSKDCHLHSLPSCPSLQRKDSGIDSCVSLETHAEEKQQSFSGDYRPTQPKCSTSNIASSSRKRKLLNNCTTAKQENSGGSETTALCSICLNAPKNSVLVHGHSGHQISCYRCAKRLYRRGKPCPVCRRRIQKVIRNFVV